MHGLQNVNVLGDYTFNSRNSKNVYDSDLMENSNYIYYGNKVKDCMDGYVVVDNCELSHEIVGAIGLNNCHSCSFVWTSFNSFYSDTCENSDNLFGCVSLKKKKYCILNKQYTKEEYEGLLSKIKEHMKNMPYIDANGKNFVYGDFFPNNFSPFCYNETAAQENFPLTQTISLENNYGWKNKEVRNYNIDIKAQDLPDSMEKTDDKILKQVIGCLHNDKNDHEKNACEAVCTEAFKVTSEELQFYKRFDLPIPRLCPNCRHYSRLKQKNPRKLWHRKCMKEDCQNEFETAYSPDRPEIVYCEKCYNQEVY
jgi:hypothetical protein